MEDNSKDRTKIPRRGMFSLLGITLLIPVVGFGEAEDIPATNPEDEAYQTLLKPDGTTVKVKVSTLHKSKVVEKNISNQSFFNWLGKK